MTLSEELTNIGAVGVCTATHGSADGKRDGFRDLCAKQQTATHGTRRTPDRWWSRTLRRRLPHPWYT